MYSGSMGVLFGWLCFQEVCLVCSVGPLVSCHAIRAGYGWLGVRISRGELLRSLVGVLLELAPGLTMGPELLRQSGFGRRCLV